MIEQRWDRRRGCGYRKPGALYLCCDALTKACGKLPVPLICCPTCGVGIRFTRGWTWVNGTALMEGKPCATDLPLFDRREGCGACPLVRPLGRCGLLWIGGMFYSRPRDWINEALEQGVSRRVKSLPNGFVLGKTWILTAHKRCIENADGTFTPGVFHVFRPERVEYVVRGDESEEEIAGLVKRGITPVRVNVDERTDLERASGISP